MDNGMSSFFFCYSMEKNSPNWLRLCHEIQHDNRCVFSLFCFASLVIQEANVILGLLWHNKLF